MKCYFFDKEGWPRYWTVILIPLGMAAFIYGGAWFIHGMSQLPWPPGWSREHVEATP